MKKRMKQEPDMADGPRKECQFKSLKEEVRNDKKDEKKKKII